MRHVSSIAGRELRGLFASPVAYVVLSLFAVLSGVFFLITVSAFSDWIFRLQQFQAFDQLAQLNLNDHLISQFFDTMAFILLFFTPAVTMGLFASEKTQGTEELLLTSPLTMWDVVLGKFAAGAAFVALLVAIVGAFPLLLFAYGDPEWGKTLAGLLGVLLVGWTYVAIGSFASSVTRSLVIAFVLALLLLLILMILPFLADLGMTGASGGRELVRYLGTETHLSELLKGLVDTSDLAYFAVAIGSFLLLTKASVESVRWR